MARTKPPGGTGGSRVRALRDMIVSDARKLLGASYVDGATGPSSFDCSGLVQYVLAQNGVTAPRTSEEQWAWVKRISRSQLKPGDLVFAQFPGDNASPGHVGIYVGGGNVLSAEDPAQGVGISTLSSWSGNIVGYGQVPGVSTAGESGAGAGGTSTQNAELDSFLSTGSGGVLSDAGALLHGTAVVLDRVFGMFAPGNGWRLVFTGMTGVAGVGAWKAFTAGGEDDGSKLPLAIGLTGVALASGFMAFRPWPQTSSGPIQPGAYVVDLLRDEPPPAGPPSFSQSEVKLTEAGLATLVGLWAASKVATAGASLATAAAGAGGILSRLWSWVSKGADDLEEGAGEAGEAG